MNTGEKLEELLSSKSFDELTPAEKELVLHELGSEDQYESMRKIGVTWFKKTGLSPDPSILRSLQAKMQEERKPDSVWTGIVSFRIPAYAAVLLIVAFCAITWTISRAPETIASAPVTIVKTDTVYLTEKPDTVYRDKIIYRYARYKHYFPQNFSRKAQDEPVAKQSEVVGVSMKENEALEKLLVSGSR